MNPRIIADLTTYGDAVFEVTPLVLVSRGADATGCGSVARIPLTCCRRGRRKGTRRRCDGLIAIWIEFLIESNHIAVIRKRPSHRITGVYGNRVDCLAALNQNRHFCHTFGATDAKDVLDVFTTAEDQHRSQEH